MFNNLTMSNDIQEEKDILGGAGVLDSAIYDFTIKMAYGTKSSGGALGFVLTLETDSGQTLRETIYTTSKEGKNYYEKNNTKNYLPGFLLATNLCLLTVKKELHQVTFEDKVIPIYDYDQKKELPTKVPVAVELIGQRITAGVLKEIVDKTAKNPSTNVYEPTGETREQNAIDKFFRIDDGMTVPELRAKATEAAFKEQWAKKNTGIVRDKAKGVNGTKSAPGASKPAAQAGAATTAPNKSLFDE
jgi:hypothetical protein